MLRPSGRALVTIINRYAFRDPHYHMPLLNWLPRPLAEALIARRGREKGGGFSDRQKLSEMHYYTMPGFRRLAAQHGFRIGSKRGLRLIIVFGDGPDGPMLVGAAIVVGSGLYALYRERVAGRARPAAASTGPAMAPDGL